MYRTSLLQCLFLAFSCFDVISASPLEQETKTRIAIRKFLVSLSCPLKHLYICVTNWKKSTAFADRVKVVVCACVCPVILPCNEVDLYFDKLIWWVPTTLTRCEIIMSVSEDGCGRKLCRLRPAPSARSEARGRQPGRGGRHCHHYHCLLSVQQREAVCIWQAIFQRPLRPARHF